eukprot:6900567-Prorocentrum_lima.AAC.1
MSGNLYLRSLEANRGPVEAVISQRNWAPKAQSRENKECFKRNGEQMVQGLLNKGYMIRLGFWRKA